MKLFQKRRKFGQDIFDVFIPSLLLQFCSVLRKFFLSNIREGAFHAVNIDDKH